MKNQAFIKSVNEADTAYVDIDTFGVTLIKGWREALLMPASVKSYVTNDSRLQDGVAIIASSEYTKKDKRDISLSFFLEGTDESDYLSKLENFLDKIAYSGEICLKVPTLKCIYKLVYSQCSKFGDYGLKKGNFTLKMTENDPSDRRKI